MRGRLRIGEVAKLLGVTPKTVRHYEKVGLLQKPERSEAGYRLYSADDLPRLHRIKRLRSLGLSLKQIRDVLGKPGSGNELRGVLEALLREVEAQIGALEERRDGLRELLSKGTRGSRRGAPRLQTGREVPGRSPFQGLQSRNPGAGEEVVGSARIVGVARELRGGLHEHPVVIPPLLRGAPGGVPDGARALAADRRHQRQRYDVIRREQHVLGSAPEAQVAIPPTESLELLDRKVTLCVPFPRSTPC